jgi:hypothetical protein
MEYRVAVGNDSIHSQFHAEELPMALLVDRQGRIALSHVGIVDKTMFEHDIEELLRSGFPPKCWAYLRVLRSAFAAFTKEELDVDAA